MKIPVFGTIGRAYAFAFGNLATIVGLVWLPLVLQVAAQYWVTAHYVNALQDFLVKRDFSAMGGIVSEYILFAIAAIFLSAVIIAPVVQQALGERRGGAIVHFGLGSAEFRLFGANLMFSLMLLTVAVLAWIALAAALIGIRLAVTSAGSSAIAGVTLAQLSTWTTIGLVAVFVGALIFVSLRLGFLVAPATISERKIDLIRAWTLTRGNFWRIVLILLATVGPVTVVSWAMQWAFVGVHASVPGFLAPAAHVQSIAGSPVSARLQLLLDSMAITLGISLFLAPLQYGLALGAASAAYRSLVPAEPIPSASGSTDAVADGNLAPAAAAS